MANIGLGWHSCVFCLATDTKEKPLKVCSGCLCDKYFAGRYCRHVLWGRWRIQGNLFPCKISGTSNPEQRNYDPAIHLPLGKNGHVLRRRKFFS